MAAGPTQRTLKYLRDLGWTAEVVEKWIPQARKRKDLFGIIDVVAIRDGETLGVQCTSDSNVAARVSKIADSEHTPALRRANWRIEVHGWKKVNGRWRCRRVDCS